MQITALSERAKKQTDENKTKRKSRPRFHNTQTLKYPGRPKNCELRRDAADLRPSQSYREANGGADDSVRSAAAAFILIGRKHRSSVKARRRAKNVGAKNGVRECRPGLLPEAAAFLCCTAKMLRLEFAIGRRDGIVTVSCAFGNNIALADPVVRPCVSIR